MHDKGVATQARGNNTHGVAPPRALWCAQSAETASLTADSQRAVAGQRGAVHLHGVAGGQAGANDQGFRDRREESEGSHGAVQEMRPSL